MTVFTLREPFGLPFGLPLVPGCQGFRLLFFTVSSLLIASVLIILKITFAGQHVSKNSNFSVIMSINCDSNYN